MMTRELRMLSQICSGQTIGKINEEQITSSFQIRRSSRFPVTMDLPGVGVKEVHRFATKSDSRTGFSANTRASDSRPANGAVAECLLVAQ